MGDSEISLSANNRADGFPSSIDPSSIQTVAVVDRVLFPISQLSSIRAVSQLHITTSGLFLFGYSLFDEGQVKSSETTAGLKTAVGGVFGAVLADSDLERARNELEYALEQYGKERSSLENEGLKSKFQKAPQVAHYFRPQDVICVRFPENGEGSWWIETIFGKIEFTDPPGRTQGSSLREWWDSAKEQAGEKGPAVPWTLWKGVLYFDKHGSLNINGLAHYFCDTLEKHGDISEVHGFLRGVFPFSTFWNFLSQLEKCGHPGAKELVQRVTNEEHRGIPKRVITGILLAVSGPFVVYYSNEMTARTSGFVALFFILAILGGIAATLYGIGRTICAVMDFFRSKAEPSADEP